MCRFLVTVSKYKLEAHHIIPRRMNGADTIRNLITLCSDCHTKIGENELDYAGLFQDYINGANPRLDYAQHVMQGKTWLRERISEVANVTLKSFGLAVNVRRDWGVPNLPDNNALALTELKPVKTEVHSWLVKPLRKKRKVKIDKSLSIVQGDRVFYSPRNENRTLCYVTAILQTGCHAGKYKLQSYNGKRYGPVSVNSLAKVSSEQGISFI